MRAVVAMDSFKGSMTSLEAGNAVKRGILRACPDAEVTVLPLADGGEGTIDAIAPFVASTDVAAGDFALIVAPTRMFHRDEQ